MCSDQQMIQEFESKRTSQKQFNLGGIPPKDGNWPTWAADVGRSLYPIQYTLSEVKIYKMKPNYKNVSEKFD